MERCNDCNGEYKDKCAGCPQWMIPLSLKQADKIMELEEENNELKDFLFRIQSALKNNMEPKGQSRCGRCKHVSDHYTCSQCWRFYLPVQDLYEFNPAGKCVTCKYYMPITRKGKQSTTRGHCQRTNQPHLKAFSYHCNKYVKKEQK